MSGGEASSVDFPAEAVFGVGLPPEAARHLDIAAASYHLEETAERHLFEARRIAPAHLAVLIGLYRFYFYKGRLGEALAIGDACLERAAIDFALPRNWRDVRIWHGDFSNYEALGPRFFMFSLKGWAYLKMRLGDLDAGRAAAEKLLELDPADKIGAKVLLDVLERTGAEEDV